MIPSKLRFQLVCVWALCLLSFIECRQKGKCLLETDGEPDDMLSLILMAKSPDVKSICAYGVIINLVWPTDDKRVFIEQIFKTAGIRLQVLDGANSPHNDKNLPFNTIDAISHKILKTELMNLDMKFYILILAPLRSLSMVLCELKEEHEAKFDNILEIYWSGGWDPDSYAADYNLYRDPEHTMKFMNLTALENKIHISSGLVSKYPGGMAKETFPKLVEFFTEHMERNDLFKGLIKRQKQWDQELKALLERSSRQELRDIADGIKGGIQFCPSDILATMLMFHPDLRKKEDLMYYTVKVVKADPHATETTNWDSMKVSVRKDKTQAEKDIKNQRERIEKDEKFNEDEILYQHQVYTAINDDPDQSKSNFKKRVISLLEKYQSQEQQPVCAQ